MAQPPPSGGLGDVFGFVALRDPERVLTPLPRVATWHAPELRVGPPVPVAVPTGRPAMLSLDDAPPLIRALDAHLAARGGLEIAADELIAFVLGVWWRLKHPDPQPPDLTLADLHADQELGQARRVCAASLLAAAYGTEAEAATRPDLMRVMQLFGLLDFLAAHPTAPSAMVVRALLDAMVLLPEVAVSDPDEEDEQAAQALATAGNAGARTLVTTGEPGAQALPASGDPGAQTLAHGAPLALTASLLFPGNAPGGRPDGIAAALALDAAADEIAELLARPRDPADFPVDVPPWQLSRFQFDNLTAATRRILDELYPSRPGDVLQTVDRLRQEAVVRYEQAALRPPDDPAAYERSAMVHELARLTGLPLPKPEQGPVVTRSGAILARPPRIGDLEVVRQKFLCYEKGEIAHVENVMAKEHRSRLHRIVDSTETEVTELTDSEEEHSWENQTTTRDELAKEAAKVVEESGGLKAGVEVSAKYGPYVEVDANVGFTKDWSSQSAERSARKYAKDVVEKAAGRTRSRVLESRRRLTRHETTDQATSGFDNTDEQAANVVGIYRWLNKRYEAQVFNLGRRVMLELVVPDPALNYRYASAAGAGLGIDAEPPPPFQHPATGAPLQPSDVTPLSWRGLAARFRAEDVDPPPVEFLTLSTVLTAADPAPKAPGSMPPLAEVNVPVWFKGDQTLQVPAGYRPVTWTAVVLTGDRVDVEIGGGKIAFVLSQRPTWGHLAVGPGSQEVHGLHDQITGHFDAGSLGTPIGLPPFAVGDRSAPLPVALCLVGPFGYSLTVTVLCRRDTSALVKWQLDVWEKLLASHSTWSRDYTSAVRAVAAGRAVTIAGRNPQEYQQVIRTELKRAAVTMLGAQLGAPLIATTAGDAAKGQDPSIVRDAAARNGPEVLFWEQAFEWENMGYLFYPYFWTGRSDWPQQSRLQDADPLFSDFLRAGAARIVLPVRPGFELTAALRLAVRLPKPWHGGPAPVLAKEPWLSVAEEIRAAQGGTDKGRPVGAPWPVVLPTTLVMLDDGADLFDPPEETVRPGGRS